ncbi:MAG: alanine racemase [Eubacteriaceae bacterium]
MLEFPLRPTWLEINLDALTHNYQEVRQIVGPKVKVLGVVKADAYGHGSIECGKALLDAGVDMLGVAFLDEAIALRQGGITREILLLGHTPEAMIPELIRWDVIPTVYQISFAQRLSDYCKNNDSCHPVHVKVDTGMGRLGFHWGEAPEKVLEISKLSGIEIQGIFTHFSTADAKDKTYTQMQMERFKKIMKDLENQGVFIPIKHCSNSGGIFDVEGAHFDMVRPGIILYGLYPSQEVDRSKIDLKPVMTLKTRIVHLKTIHQGDTLSYGNQYLAENDRRIGTLPLGYADGFTRMLSHRVNGWIRGQLAPIVGNICMDQCMIDLTDIGEVSLNEPIEIFGEHISADDLAETLGTINYEITCLMNKRIPRLYLENSEIKNIRRDILEGPLNLI